MKEEETSTPIIYASNWSQLFELMWDTQLCDGAVLGQRFNNQPQVNYYASRTLNNAHRNYFTMEKEFLAMELTLEKFRSYLIG